MDSMTIIAVASIVIAGLTTGFGTMGPALGGGPGGRDGADLAGAAAGRLRHHHPNPVRRPGDDRVHGHLLLRGLDDSPFRQSVLESRHRPGRRELVVLIDWFTVAAQVINFLILVWLLKRFLYRPILDAIDAREERIAAELADADAKKAEARKERDEFQHKNEAFEQQRATLLSQATDEAKAERQRLLDEARQAADTLSAQRLQTLSNDSHQLNQAIRRRTQAEVFAIARKALTDLATASLEERMAEVFIRRLRALDGQAKEALAEALKRGRRTRAGAQCLRPARGATRGGPSCAQRNLLGGNSGQVRDRARSGQRDRAQHEWTKAGLEHRGLPRGAGTRHRRAAEDASQDRSG